MPRYKLKEKPFDESFMEIQTHVLTNPQPSLRADTQEAATRRSNARSNIEAAKKPTNTSVDNLAGFDANGEIVDSGVAKADLVHDAEYVHIDGYVKDAVVTEDGKKLTLTKDTGDQVDFMGGSGLPTPTPEDEGYVLTVGGGQAVWEEPSHVDVSGKMDKVQGAPENNLVAFDNKGNAKNSGIATSAVSDALSKLGGISDGANKVEASTTNGNIKIDNVETPVYVHPTMQENAAAARMVGNNAQGHVVLGKAIEKGDIGLGNVDNTSDADKPISTATQEALDLKVDKKAGKGLSTNDFTNAYKADVDANTSARHTHANKQILDDTTASYTSTEKTKLGSIETGAQVNVIETVKVDGAALTPENKAVNIDLSGKQDLIVFDGEYDSSTNKAATVSTVTTAVADKADKVSNATDGHLAGLDGNGNLTDSGKKASDFATDAQGAKADSAIQGIKLNGDTVAKDSANVVDLGNLKTKQLFPVNDPNEGNNDGLTFIKHVAQNENGNLTVLSKATVQDGTTSQKGVVQLQDSIASSESSTTTAPTPRAVREAIANAVASVYHHAGTKVVADLTSSLLVAENEGCVYNMTDAGTTTADFIEGAGNPIRIGDNVGVCKVSSNPDTYKFDLLSGFVDLSNYKTKQQVKSDPTKNGESVEYIDSLSQDANGEITATKKGIPYASTSQQGIVKLSDTVADNHTTAATPYCVKQAYDLADSAVKGVQKNGTDITLDANKKANVIVNDAKLKIKLGSGSVAETGFTADAATDATIEVPLADYSGSTYTEGLMTGQEKEKLNGIASGAEVNSIESITIEGDQSALPISQENVTIPKAKYSGSTYTSGVITGQDQKKIDGIEAGAQVNDIEHIKIEGESADLTITDKSVTLPLAASATTSPVASAKAGIMSASDKDKLDTLKNFSMVQVSDGGATPTYTDVTPADDNSIIKFIPGRNINIIGDNIGKSVTIEATGVASTVSEGNGIKVNHTQDPITGINNYEVNLGTKAEEAIAIAEAVQSTIDERIITNMSFSEIHKAYSYGSSFSTTGHGQFYGTLFTPVMTQEVKPNAKIGVYIRNPGTQGEIAFAIYQFDLTNPGYIDLVCHTDFYECENLPAADGSTTSAFREFAVTYISPTCNVMSSDKLYYSVAITRDDNNRAACAIQGFYGTEGYDSQLNGIPQLTIARTNLENLTDNDITKLTSATIRTYLGRIAKANLGNEQNSTPRVFMSIRNAPQAQNV